MTRFRYDASHGRWSSRGGGGAGRALLVTAAIAVVMLGGCGDDDDEPEAAGGEAASLNGSSWILSTYVVASQVVDASGVAALDFGADGKTLNGSTGCNNFGGEFEQSGSQLTVELGPMTLAACLDDLASDQQQAILELLPQVVSFLGGEQLTLQDDTGSTLLVYNPGTIGLEGTSWTATGVNTGSAVESTALTESITIVFGADGSLSGFSGCNQYTATYETSGGDVEISDIATTRMACDEPASTLEAQYTAALAEVTNYDISGATLTLRDADGAIQATFTIDS